MVTWMSVAPGVGVWCAAGVVLRRLVSGMVARGIVAGRLVRSIGFVVS
jgi:hypothetical protein